MLYWEKLSNDHKKQQYSSKENYKTALCSDFNVYKNTVLWKVVLCLVISTSKFRVCRSKRWRNLLFLLKNSTSTMSSSLVFHSKTGHKKVKLEDKGHHRQILTAKWCLSTTSYRLKTHWKKTTQNQEQCKAKWKASTSRKRHSVSEVRILRYKASDFKNFVEEWVLRPSNTT